MEKQKIQEMQFLEHNLQNLLLQKQSFQMELSEINSALKELENSGDETFKIIGQLMIKAEKPKILKELAEKQKILNLRIKTIQGQENSLAKQLDFFRKELLQSKK
ncbi:MAG: prefoldin subunit [Nanoarchaeota archaeon]|nr:prefoldin subunit [Nanoarchaeota archaeon]MBU4308361.1 prefoldin subunit [Nanoarchaeota archaeon]